MRRNTEGVLGESPKVHPGTNIIFTVIEKKAGCLRFAQTGLAGWLAGKKKASGGPWAGLVGPLILRK